MVCFLVGDDAWIQAGKRLLRDEGHDGVRIDRLCEVLGLTKGSFYHHFESRAGFVRAMLDQWLAEELAALEEHPPGTGYAGVIELVARIDAVLEVQLRAWSRVDADVRAATARVDAARIGYYERHVRAVLPPGADAAFVARLAYSSLVGAQTLGIVNRSAEGVREWNRKFLRTIHAEVNL